MHLFLSHLIMHDCPALMFKNAIPPAADLAVLDVSSCITHTVLIQLLL